ncbi:MAG: DNA methyltransferase [Candidatus Saccharibacteria bacterium]
MNQSVVILGRQPALGLAELESLYGADVLHPVSQQIALLDVDPAKVQFARLGGTVKLARLLTRLNNTSFKSVVAQIAKTIPEQLQNIPEGKIRLGLNVFGLDVKVDEINRAGLEIKKAVKKAGRSVRVVPNNANELNSAQTIHNQLTGPTGLEFVIVRDGTSVLIAQVVNVQDISGYAARDQTRPKRDAQVGMLPPKLAQTIINLSSAQPGQTVLDPFCGTGVILQESVLMGLGAYGTDLEPRMIEYSQANLDWLRADTAHVQLEVGDATNLEWSRPYDTIASETYLGRPFSSDPTPEVLGQVSRDVDTIHRKFLKNLAQQTPSGFTASLAVPAWKIRNGFKHLPCLDSLEELGYTRRSFVHVSDSDLVYHRPDQIVGRELVVVTRK